MVKRIVKIETFAQSIEAARVLARAVMTGHLDDCGDYAMLQPDELVLTNGRTTGTNMTVNVMDDDHSMVEGHNVYPDLGLELEFAKKGSNVRFLPTIVPSEEEASAASPPAPKTVRLSVSA